jgi:pimeloyl-ACP methyl ester carboxylesterase
MPRRSATTAAHAAPADGWSRTRSTDGTPIAWRLDPAESPAAPQPTTVVLCNGIGCTDSHWCAVAPELVRTHPVVRWHYRGHGLSGSPADPARVDVPAVADDLRAVLRAAGAERAVLVGHSYGVQVALEAARTERQLAGGVVAGVVAVAGVAGHPLSRALRPRATTGGAGTGTQPAAADELAALARHPVERAGEALLAGLERISGSAPQTTTRLWRQLWQSPLTSLVARGLRGTSGLTPAAALADYCQHVSELDVTLVTRMFRGMQAHSAFDLLEDLDVPLLCVAGAADGFTPLAVMAGMARRAPQGRLEVVPAAAHTLPVERPEVLLAALRRFLRPLDAAPGAASEAGAPAPAEAGAA